MGSSDTTSTKTALYSYSPSPSSSPPAAAVLSPCAACKVLRRRCVDKCVLAPYFPPTDPQKFTNAHRVFGASNIIKLLQDIPVSQRADAVSSMVYEANARIRDPVYGCAGAIFQLQRQVNELQAQLARAQAEAVNVQAQNANVMALICMGMSHTLHDGAALAVDALAAAPLNDSFSLDDGSLHGGAGAAIWEAPIWT
ncbi:LOB domain-containing protein 1-like [Musa acuminata AAA Group]|uniref:LOB domain-containing protein 1-like n=1 Tax=Musa acuminata AAA Group TaxID=214697 RepID=UPI0031E3D419